MSKREGMESTGPTIYMLGMVTIQRTTGPATKPLETLEVLLPQLLDAATALEQHILGGT
ncbi:hypothetical protein ES703_54886 [subsurface metagenome]